MADTGSSRSDAAAAVPAETPDGAPATGSRSRRAVAAAGVTGTLILALAVFAVVLLVRIGKQPDVHPLSKNATFTGLEQNGMLAARAEVLKLTTLSVTNADAQIASLLADATGSFRVDLTQIATQLKTAVVSQKVSTVGKIDASGVMSSDAATQTVTVLVAAEQQVKNTSAPSGEPRTYRLRVTMQRVKGRFLVANMAFVA